MTPDLMRYLLRENLDIVFGAFGVDDDGDIAFEHTIPAATIDKEELRASVMAVVFIADRYDEEITSGWGGLRATDRTPSN